MPDEIVIDAERPDAPRPETAPFFNSDRQRFSASTAPGFRQRVAAAACCGGGASTCTTRVSRSSASRRANRTNSRCRAGGAASLAPADCATRLQNLTARGEMKLGDEAGADQSARSGVPVRCSGAVHYGGWRDGRAEKFRDRRRRVSGSRAAAASVRDVRHGFRGHEKCQGSARTVMHLARNVGASAALASSEIEFRNRSAGAPHQFNHKVMPARLNCG